MSYSRAAVQAGFRQKGTADGSQLLYDLMKPRKTRLRNARQLLKRAREQHDQAAIHSWEPSEPAECVTKCFYSFENGLTAAAEALGKRWTTKHYEKVALATQLFRDGDFKSDISSRLSELNDLRKDVQYGEPGANLLSVDMEDILSELEDFLDDVDSIVSDLAGGN